MFAKRTSSDDYHLLDNGEENTLCGLKVAPIIIDHSIKSSHLHLTSTKPINHKLCAGCAAVMPGEAVKSLPGTLR
jgi:hypothetical protein